MNKYLVLISLLSLSLCFDLEAIRQEALSAHNVYRKLHGADPLTFDADLNKIAQDYASSLGSICDLQHSENKYTNGDYLGENLAMFYGAAPTGQKATDIWYEEEALYDYNGDWQYEAGHFSQLVWKSTKKFGLGIGYCQKENAYYVVGNYYPSGNYLGQFQKNVSPKGTSTGTSQDTQTTEPPQEEIQTPETPKEEETQGTGVTVSFTYGIENVIDANVPISFGFNGVEGTVKISGQYGYMITKFGQSLKGKYLYKGDNKLYDIVQFLLANPPSNPKYKVNFEFTIASTFAKSKELYDALAGGAPFTAA